MPRLVAGKEDPAPVRKPGRRLDQDVGPRERFWLSGAGGEERELRVLLTLPPRRQDPAPIRREAPRPSISDADGGRAVELAQVDALRLDVLLFEEDRLPVGGDALGKRPVEPGEIALDSVGCGNAHDLAAGGLHGAENAPVARNVPEESRGNVPERPGLARKRSRRDAVASARPDFVASRRPREPGDRERAGQPQFAVRVDDFHVAVVVSAQRVVDERDEAAVGRDADVAYPAGRVIQDLSDRVVEPVAVPHVARHGQTLAVGRPVGILHVLEDLAWRAARQRNPRQRAGRFEAEHEVTVERERELPRGGDREEAGPRQPQRARFGTSGARREDIQGEPFPGCGVNDRLRIWSEPRGHDGTARVGQLRELDGRARPGVRSQTAKQESCRDAYCERGGRRQNPSAPARAGGFDRLESAGGRGLRQMVADALQIAREVLGGGVTLFGIFREQALDDPSNWRGGLRRELSERFGLLPDDCDESLGAGLPLERALAGRHLVEDRAERELIRAEVEGLAARLLGRHVPGRAHDRAGLGRPDHGRQHGRVLRNGLGQFRQPEVENLDVAVLRDHQVLGLQIPVHDPGRMGLGETVGGLHGDVEKPLRRERLPRRQELAKGLSVHELHRDVGGSLGFADVVDRQDVRVVQGRGRARFLLEALAAIGMGGRVGRQHLDRHVASEPGVGRAIDLSHPARADRGGDAVLAETAADHDEITPGFFNGHWICERGAEFYSADG